MNAIRWMAWNGGYGGQGRTVDALVEAVADGKTYIEGYARAAAALNLLQNSLTPVNPAEVQQLQAALMINSGILIDRLRKFVGVDTERITVQVRKQLEARAKAVAEARGQQQGKSGAGLEIH